MTFRRRSRGRYFSTRYDTKRMETDMQSSQEQLGVLVLWWFFDPTDSVFNQTYGEGDRLAGRRYTGPIEIPVLSAVRVMGDRRPEDAGLFTVDTLVVRMSYEQARRAGLGPDIDLNTTPHTLDRLGYEDRIFEISDIRASGQYDPTHTYLTLNVEAKQLRPDELVFDPDFVAYSA